ncbi:(2Fe-2S)-binding protein [Roseateles sp. DC23W]|uniref:(2Fe-2S)-binding protein n=1 Tax=Pelomonas dachongensis TaxID=3299029 RepID=A0ABW7EJ00_9BURK
MPLRINGCDAVVDVKPWTSLLDLLRHDLQLTGTKKGCDHGQCGACTVLIDGMRVNACLVLAVCAQGCEVTTIEGLAAQAGDSATASGLHPLQQSFIDCDALQCGYCTPGQLCSAAGLLNEHPPENRQEIRERMSGNLCRCGAYPQIVDAVARVVLGPDTAPAAIVASTAAMTATRQTAGEERA